MSESLRNAMVKMAMGKAPARTKEELQAFLESQRMVTYHDHTEPIESGWKDTISGKWWGTEYTGPLSKRERAMLPLRDHLLSIAGEEVCMPEVDPDLQMIMDFGQIWIGQNRVQMRRGEPNRCHSNSARYWKKEKNKIEGTLGIATGYALSEDNMWRQHSWCVLKKPRSYQIIETTTSRELYYGFCMLDIDAELFCSSILDW